MKVGYPCVNRSIGCSASSTFRLKSFTEDRFLETVRGNLACLGRMLEYNADKGLLFFRVTSDLIPFASHPVCTVPWREVFADEFARLGRSIRDRGMRVSMHPDQFTLINTPDEGIAGRSVRELAYHAAVLDALGLDRTARIQIHVGGVYDDRAAAMDRFVTRYRLLPDAVRRRLVIENDDRSYTADDCLALHGATGVPVLFDTFHHQLNSGGKDLRDSFAACAGTWGAEDGLVMVDYSSQQAGGRAGSHTDHIDLADFLAFARLIAPLDCDVMFEIKDKELSALEAAAALAADPRFVGGMFPR